MQHGARAYRFAGILIASAVVYGCEKKEVAPAKAPSGATGGVAPPGITAVPLLAPDKLFDLRPPVVIGWAPDPEFPQTNFAIIGRTVTPRVLETSERPGSPGKASFTLGWQSAGSPSQVDIYRQSWILGANNTKEFTQGPAEKIASLGALSNGYHTWTDSMPALNTRNCYYVQAGDGTYWSYSHTACAYSPDPFHPHAIGKVSLRLRLSNASTAVTSSNVRVLLHYGIPGNNEGIAYTWLDANDTPFFTPGDDATFMLRIPGIKDLSDITMIRVEVPGNDGLCLNELELIADDAVAFRKTSSGTQQCGNANPFEWAWHSGFIDGTAVDIPFQELRNSTTWKNFNPRIWPNTVSASRPDGASFVGYTPSELRRKIDGLTAHNLKDDGTDLGSTVRRFRNGTNDVTSMTWVNDHTLRIQQHLRLADGGGCTVDAHPIFNLVINSLNANGQPAGGADVIESTKITTNLISSGIDQGGLCTFAPTGVQLYIQIRAASDFAKEFRAAGATEAGKPPAGMRFCFPKAPPTTLRPYAEFDNGGLSLCFGNPP